ncbi:MAG: hypothetical protein INR65_20295 [Gluconacetobacter diazotrophicus]|nr:hypothetical protein [Gluconacetobacter diazotrophicus]
MGIVAGIIVFAILLLGLTLFGGIDTITDFVRRRRGRTADSKVIADSRDNPES